MSEKNKLNLGLSAYEDLFKDDTELAEEKLPRIHDIPLELIDDFPEHPFKVKMDEDMDQLVESIKERGLITPITLRPKDNGRFEIVSGHRRKKACEIAGLSYVKADVREMTRDEAIILMVESNLQRSVILPSEKAFSYKMRLEALKRQGKRTDLTSVPSAQKSKTSREILGDIVGESQDNVRRYIRLTELVPNLLDLVDDGKIGLRPAVELSYLKPEEQELVYKFVEDCECTPSHAQTIRMRRISENGGLNAGIIEDIMLEEKPNQKEKVHISLDKVQKFIPGMTIDKAEDYIIQALEFYQKYHAKTQTQNKQYKAR